jgi:hypothetical protein
MQAQAWNAACLHCLATQGDSEGHLEIQSLAATTIILIDLHLPSNQFVQLSVLQRAASSLPA